MICNVNFLGGPFGELIVVRNNNSYNVAQWNRDRN